MSLFASAHRALPEWVRDHAESIAPAQAIASTHGLDNIANEVVNRLSRGDSAFARHARNCSDTAWFTATAAQSVRLAAGRLLRNNASAVLADDPKSMIYEIDPVSSAFLRFEHITNGLPEASRIAENLYVATLETLRDLFAKAGKIHLSGFMSEKIAAANRGHANANFRRVLPND